MTSETVTSETAELRFNLIQEAWIPVRRKSGERDTIRPAEIADRGDPPVAIMTCRPDFDGALLQFLIGLLQTCAAPHDEEVWAEWFEEPPSVAALHALFEVEAAAFELLGPGRRFMQDREVEVDGADLKRCRQLLIDAPGDSTLKNNQDLFVKRAATETASFGLATAAMALLTLQINAPSGGAGHRTGLRGGGPITMLPAGADLWQSLWCCVFHQRGFNANVPGDPKRRDTRFPWMQPTRTSSGGTPTTPLDVHPLVHYWAMPRRIQLVLGEEPGICALSGEAGPAVEGYVTVKHGANYEGAFLHPLSPHTLGDAEKPPLAVKGQPGGISYGEWPNWVLGTSTCRLPLWLPVLRQRKEALDLEDVPNRIHVFGYDVDKAKARAWQEATIPAYSVSAAYAETLASVATGYAAAAKRVSDRLREGVAKALALEGIGKKALGATLRKGLYAATSTMFEDLLGERLAGLRAEDESAPSTLDLPGSSSPRTKEALAEAWLGALQKQVLAAFKETVYQSGDLGALNIGRVARHRQQLAKEVGPSNNTLRKLVGLPQITTKRGKKATAAATPA